MIATAARRTTMMFACSGVEDAQWLDALRKALPGIDLRVWPDIGNRADIDYAFIWRPQANALDGLSNLRAIFALGAGVEHLLADRSLPQAIPLVRMIDPSLAIGMREFVLLRVLHYHRRIPEYEANQRLGRWVKLVPKLPGEQRVGLLGLGQLGTTCAESLVGLGFDVAGWSRSKTTLSGVESFSGVSALGPFLARSDIVVCLLPLTPETDHILDRRAFDAMPTGSHLINVARGRHVVEADLLDALDSGKIAGATLDVFEDEPLPAGHPFWTHPSVTVIPHCAALTHPVTASRTVADNIARLERGQPMIGVVDRLRGY